MICEFPEMQADLLQLAKMKEVVRVDVSEHFQEIVVMPGDVRHVFSKMLKTLSKSEA